MNRVTEAMRAFSLWLTPDHVYKMTADHYFQWKATEAVIARPRARIADIGAGKRWFLPDDLKTTLQIHLTGVDISAEEMAHNAALDEKLACDACADVPTPTGPYALITCRAGVEHFWSVDRFLRNCAAALAPGGVAVVFFTNRYAPFAILNRMLPARWSQALLRSLTRSGAQGLLGFRAYYDNTSFSQFSRLVRKNGFVIEQSYSSYFSSTYFTAIPPLYVVSLLTDYLRFMIGWRDFASHHCFVLRKA